MRTGPVGMFGCVLGLHAALVLLMCLSACLSDAAVLTTAAQQKLHEPDTESAAVGAIAA